MVGRASIGAAVAAVCTCLLLSAGFASAAPAPADIDRSFGVRGVAPGKTFSSAVPARLAIGRGNGLFVLYRNFLPCSDFFCLTQLPVARFKPNGRPITAFGAGGPSFVVRQNSFQQSDVAVGPDGKPVIAAFDFQQPRQHLLVARLGSDGRLDPSFGAGGIAEVAGIAAGGGWPAVAVQRDGRIVVAAHDADSNGLAIARFLPNGAPDPGFGVGGLALASFGSLSQPAGLIPGADGSILVGLSSCCHPIFNKSSSVVFARFLADGRLTPSFGAGNGWTSVPRPVPSRLTAITAAPRRGAYALLEAEPSHGERHTLAIKLRADGGLARRFARQGVLGFGRGSGAPKVTAIVADARGRLIAAAGSRRGILTRRLLANGQRDRTFAGGGYTRTAVGGSASAAGAGLQSNGRLVLLAEMEAGEARRFVVARLWAGGVR